MIDDKNTEELIDSDDLAIEEGSVVANEINDNKDTGVLAGRNWNESKIYYDTIYKSNDYRNCMKLKNDNYQIELKCSNNDLEKYIECEKKNGYKNLETIENEVKKMTRSRYSLNYCDGNLSKKDYYLLKKSCKSKAGIEDLCSHYKSSKNIMEAIENCKTENNWCGMTKDHYGMLKGICDGIIINKDDLCGIYNKLGFKELLNIVNQKNKQQLHQYRKKKKNQQ
mgnify:CR=1 FL=1